MNRVKMWSFHVLLGLLVLTGINLSSWSTEAYNVETRHFASYRGPYESMFGFSVAEYRDGHGRGWVIVGAPKADSRQPEVTRGGAVFRCDVAGKANCTLLPFDTQSHNAVRRPTEPHDRLQIDNKTMQWFGATVSTSQRDGGPILACAPRYTFFGIASGTNRMWEPEDIRSREPAFGNQRDPVGTCFLKNDLHSGIREFSPCRTKNYGYPKQGSCQAGFSAAMSKNGERLFVGAPGSWYWQGQEYSIASDTDIQEYVPPNIELYGAIWVKDEEGQAYVYREPGKVMFTKAWPESEDDSYLGYSMATGDFTGTGKTGSAVGKPRGFELRGQVLLLTENATIIQTINGENVMGSYFGYALAAGDVDNDGLDELFVGAPMFTIPDNTEMNYETGRIYVYYGKGPNKYTEYTSRDGESNRGRFGMSIAYLGDIDRDGYGDIAVGAPYGGHDGSGAVYIYLGSANGLLEKYSQVIYGRDISYDMRTFGFSLAGGLDLDNNLYPDIVVGAYDSDRAMFFRSRPVIKMVADKTFVQFNSFSKLISLDNRTCVLSQPRRQVTCLDLKICFMYTGEGVLSRYRFNVQYVLDAKKPNNPRLSFIEYEGQHQMNKTIEVDQNEQYCRTIKVYVVPNIRDKLTSLDAEMRITLEDELQADNRPRNPLLPLRPSMARTSSWKDSVAIWKNCGSDNICTPDLQLTCKSSVTEYLMGSEEKIKLNVTVYNAYEDAFEATYNLILPPGVEYTKVDNIETAEIPVRCSPVQQGSNYTVKCDIGNPLPNGTLVKFIVYLKPTTSGMHEEMSTYVFEMEANSSNVEPSSTTYDNRHRIVIDIGTNTEFIIEGESKPRDVYYNPDNYTSMDVTTELQYGPSFVHNYTIRNRGPSRIEEAEIFLVWPIETLAGDDFFYLLEQPETSSNLKCATANANALSLKLEKRHRISQGSYTVTSPYAGTPGKTDISDTYSGSSGTSTAHGGTWSSGGTHGSATETGSVGVSTSTGGNATHSVSYGQDGSMNVTEEDWVRINGEIVKTNITTVTTEERKRTNTGTIRTHEDGTQAYEKRRKEDEARQKPPGFIYGTETHYTPVSTTHGGSSHDFSHNLGGSVVATGIRTEDRISGDREETVGGTDFDLRIRNVSASQDLDRILSTLTSHSVGTDIYRERGETYLRFFGRFGFEEDRREYIEFKDGMKFPLEDRYGDQSYAGGGVIQGRQFRAMTGRVIVTDDGKAYIQLSDERKFPLQGSYTYTETRTYTRGGSGPYGGSSFSSTSDGRGTTSSHGESWGERSYNREREFNKEVEIHSTRTQEESKTFQRQGGSRVYSRNGEMDDSFGDVSAQYRSGIHKRGSRHRREGDAISIDDFRKYEKLHGLHKLHKLHKRNVDEDYNDDGTIDGESDLNPETSAMPTCKSVQCVTLQCTVGRLEKDEEVWISARYSVKGTTLKKIVGQEELKVSSQVFTRVTKVPFVGRPARDIVKTQEIFTILKPEKPKNVEPQPVPLWIVVLSACAGVIILLLLIFLLHKCGFFKRNRPTDAPERQPLNRNGHFQGDDHL